MSNKDKTNNFLRIAIDSIEDVKGDDIKILDLTKIESSVFNYMIFCTGNSNTQVSSIASSVEKRLSKRLKEKPYSKEGLDNAQWVLIDYVNVVVHVFQKEFRKYYDVEGLWADGIELDIESLKKVENIDSL